MADHQIGTTSGVQAVSNTLGSLLLSDITADGVSTVTISDLSKIVVGQSFDIINKTTGAVLGAGRVCTSLTSAGLLTYSGGDVAAVPGTHGVYPVGAAAPTPRSNQNGGVSDRAGWDDAVLGSVDMLINRLVAANAGYWTAARIAAATVNDLVYAVRLLDAAGSVR